MIVLFFRNFLFLALALSILLTACGSGGSSAPEPVKTPPPTGGGGGTVDPDPDPVNVNIDNPTLKTFDNVPITDVNNMTLVWSEEFDDTQLDPETRYFENGNGSQYGLTDWGNNELHWYLEDNATINNWSTPSAPFPAPFDETFYILLNIAVGGNWPGSPDSTTDLPQTLEVDYIRVYEGN